MRDRCWHLLVFLVALTSCHPRYDLRGTGGSGSFETVKARMLVLLATGDLAQAREYLELAADLTQEQHDRFEQMISAAERGLVPFLDEALEHIFRKAPGHFEVETAEARELIQTTVTEANFVGTRKGTYLVYQRLLDAGGQIWAYVFNGTIRDGGQNDVPLSTDQLLGRRGARP